MAGFVYYFPGSTLPILDASKIPPEAGLAHLATAPSISFRQCENNGPDNGAGGLVTVEPAHKSTGSAGRCGFYPDKQVWTPVEKKDGDQTKIVCWIGYDKDEPPTPPDLVREGGAQGWPVEMGGHQWVVPTVHLPATTLPMKYRMTANGPTSVVKDEYEELCRDMADWIGRTDEEKPQDSFMLVSRVIGVNYFVGPWEIGILGLLDSNTLMQCLKAAIGIYWRDEENEEQKKTLTRPVGV